MILTTRSRQRCRLPLLLLALAACTPERPAASAPRCFALTVGRWEFPDKEDRRVRSLPEIVALYPHRWPPGSVDTTVHGLLGFTRRGDLWKGLNPAHPRRQFAAWQPKEGNRLALFFSTGFSGVKFDLDGHDDRLLGTAQIFTDVVGQKLPRASVSARRTRCPRLATSTR